MSRKPVFLEPKACKLGFSRAKFCIFPETWVLARFVKVFDRKMMKQARPTHVLEPKLT